MIPNPKIKFAYPFYKLQVVGMPTRAKLINALEVNYLDLGMEFIEYDTMYPGGKYQLERTAKVILLTFGTEKGIFTTIRSGKRRGLQGYKQMVGQYFDVEIHGQ